MTIDELNARMAELELTVADLALIAGTTRRAVEKWRSGMHPVPRMTAIILDAMAANQLSPDWLMDWLARQD
jgi:hypothetical protein